MPYILKNQQHTEIGRVPFPKTYPISPTNSSITTSPTISGPPSPVDPHPEDRARPRKKSSLKTGRPYQTPSPSRRDSPMRRTRSVPQEMPKLVHFPSQDTDLQSVRTFRMAQRPVAISNPGSDDEQSSEDEETDTVSSVDTSKYRINVAQSRLPNTAVPNDGYIKLDAIDFGYDAALRGRVRVKNVAYKKRVAARFSLDNWESTSEVLASHFSSSPCGQWDTFTFAIRLEDMKLLNRVLSLCLHYVADDAGQWWDNNNARDYAIVFEPVRDSYTAAMTHFPRRRSATVDENMSAAALPRVHHTQNRGEGWQNWAQNRVYNPRKSAVAEATTRPAKLLFVM